MTDQHHTDTLFEAARIALTTEEGSDEQIAAQNLFFHYVEQEIDGRMNDALADYCHGATVPEMVIAGLRAVFSARVSS